MFLRFGKSVGRRRLPADLSDNKLLQNLPALMNMVRRIALEAGEIVLKYYDDLDGAEIDAKADGSPVSLADKEAEAFIEPALKALIAEIPMVGEEASAEGHRPDLTQEEYFWLVDPLDGTKEFISGGEDFTVNIGLIHKGRPVMGVVYAPAKGVLYAGCEGHGAIRWSEDTDKEKPITVRPCPAEGLVVVSSKSHGDASKLDQFLEGFKVQKSIKCGSSLKICVIAEGKADLYPRFGPTCEWDTAAAHAVLLAAGGMLTCTEGNMLGYGGIDPKFLNPEFIASSFAWYEEAA